MFVPAAALTWGIHEYAHWQMGELLGYEMWITLNQAGPIKGSFDSVRDQILVAAAGPIVTYLQALVALLLIVRWRQPLLYPFLFLPLWTRALAMAFSAMHPNDEARISMLTGLPWWALPAIAVAVLLVMTVAGSRRLGIVWKGNLIAYVMSSLVTAAIVAGDQSPLLAQRRGGAQGVFTCGCSAPVIESPRIILRSELER